MNTAIVEGWLAALTMTFPTLAVADEPAAPGGPALISHEGESAPLVTGDQPGGGPANDPKRAAG
jgi:hypothetical protein